jgi:hypothetical protein
MAVEWKDIDVRERGPQMLDSAARVADVQHGSHIPWPTYIKLCRMYRWCTTQSPHTTTSC